MKIYRIILIIDILLFFSFIFMEGYQILFDYHHMMNSLSLLYPCSIWFRLPHYFLSLLILLCCLYGLIKSAMGKIFDLLLLSCIGFICYDLVFLVSMFVPFLKLPCFMSGLESTQIVYFFSFLQLIYFLKNKRKFHSLLNSRKIVIFFLAFTLFFLAMRITLEYL